MCLDRTNEIKTPCLDLNLWLREKESIDSTTELLTLLRVYSYLSNIIAFEHYEIRKDLMNGLFSYTVKDGNYSYCRGIAYKTIITNILLYQGCATL